jgi:hypothetical protein
MEELEQALMWAENNNYHSVAAEYSRILAAEVRRLQEEFKNHRCGLPASIQEALNSGDGVYRP